MFEMVDVADRSAIVLSLKGYEEGLRMAPDRRVMVGGVFVDTKTELRKVKRLAEMFTNQFVYVSDEVMDREKLYQQKALEQPKWIQLLLELLDLVNDATVSRSPNTIDIDATNRMREIVAVLNAGGF